MKRSIIPQGFEKTAHPLFANYEPPIYEVYQRDQSVKTQEKTKCDVECFKGASSWAASDTPPNCPICLQQFTDPTTVALCGHSFCSECLLHWFTVRLLCPLCKSDASFFIKSRPKVTNCDASLSLDFIHAKPSLPVRNDRVSQRKEKDAPTVPVLPTVTATSSLFCDIPAVSSNSSASSSPTKVPPTANIVTQEKSTDSGGICLFKVAGGSEHCDTELLGISMQKHTFLFVNKDEKSSSGIRGGVSKVHANRSLSRPPSYTANLSKKKRKISTVGSTPLVIAGSDIST